MEHPRAPSDVVGWTRRPPGRLRAAIGLAGALALIALAHDMRGAAVSVVAVVTAALILVATLRHDQVVRWSEDHGAIANLAVAPPAYVGLACAVRTMPLEIAALVAVTLGLALAVLWCLLADRGPRRTGVPAPPRALRVHLAPASAPPPTLWARPGPDLLALEQELPAAASSSTPQRRRVSRTSAAPG